MRNTLCFPITLRTTAHLLLQHPSIQRRLSPAPHAAWDLRSRRGFPGIYHPASSTSPCKPSASTAPCKGKSHSSHLLPRPQRGAGGWHLTPLDSCPGTGGFPSASFSSSSRGIQVISLPQLSSCQLTWLSSKFASPPGSTQSGSRLSPLPCSAAPLEEQQKGSSRRSSLSHSSHFIRRLSITRTAFPARPNNQDGISSTPH